MSSANDMDSLFDYLYCKGAVYTPYRTIVKEHFKGDESTWDIEGMLIKLDKDGYVDTGEKENDRKLGWTKETTYKISYEGRLLFENSSQNKPYFGLNNKKRLNKIYTVTRIVITAINSVAILYLMWKAIPGN